jgi:hypothetical protein
VIRRLILRPLARPIEYLTLRKAFADAERLDPARRASLARAAQTAMQKRDSAEVLAARGLSAAAIELAIEAARLQRECLEAVAGGVSTGTRRVRRAQEQAELAIPELSPAPQVDGEVTGAQRRALRALLAAELSLQHPIREALFARRRLLVLRVQRAVTALMVVLSPLALAAFVRGSFLGLTARASSTLDDQYTADRVLDGDPDTEWVPTGAEEWLEVRFRTRLVHHVRILNGDTLPDRAAKEFHVDFYDHQDGHPTSTRKFERQRPAQWQTIDVAGLRCDRIIITITSHYGSGAALAEVEID